MNNSQNLDSSTLVPGIEDFDAGPYLTGTVTVAGKCARVQSTAYCLRKLFALSSCGTAHDVLILCVCDVCAAAVMAVQFVNEVVRRVVAASKGIKLGPPFLVPNSQLGCFGSVTQLKSLVRLTLTPIVVPCVDMTLPHQVFCSSLMIR